MAEPSASNALRQANYEMMIIDAQQGHRCRATRMLVEPSACSLPVAGCKFHGAYGGVLMGKW
jgi:hypothetical protein